MSKQKAEAKPVKLFVATPMYGGQCILQYMNSLLQLQGELIEKKIPFGFCFMAGESLITRARNNLTRQFLESDCTHLMFIDGDIEFPPGSVLRLLGHDEDVVAGIYPKKQINWDNICAAAQRGEPNAWEYAGNFVLNAPPGVTEMKANKKGLIELAHAGTGFMLIKRRVFTKLAKHVKQYRGTLAAPETKGSHSSKLTHEFFATSISDELGDLLLSEDYFFCELWRKHGGKVYGDASFQLNHIGPHVFSGNIIRCGASIT